MIGWPLHVRLLSGRALAPPQQQEPSGADPQKGFAPLLVQALPGGAGSGVVCHMGHETTYAAVVHNGALHGRPVSKL